MGHSRLMEPSEWVSRFIGGVVSGGTILDLACGSGRHMRLALMRGHPVVGIDRDLSGVADISIRNDVSLIRADLEDGSRFPLLDERFSGIIVTNYLYRPLFPVLAEICADDGVLIYETFALGHERHGRPVNRDYLLYPNELIEAFSPSLVIIAFEHGEISGKGGRRIVQRLVAVGRKHPWAGPAPLQFG